MFNEAGSRSFYDRFVHLSPIRPIPSTFNIQTVFLDTCIYFCIETEHLSLYQLVHYLISIRRTSRIVYLLSVLTDKNRYIMTIDFYYLPGSAPCRNVLLAAKAVGVELNLKYTDIMKGEHLTPEFIKINPQHTIPTLDDNGFAIWESRAIMTYLQQQYGKDDSLYPKDPKRRALVDQRLYFDMGTLYSSFYEYYSPIFFGDGKSDPAKFEKVNDAFKFLDIFIGNNDYSTGNNLTLADLALVSTVSTFEVMNYDLSPYKNVSRWFAKVKATAPGYEEANGKPVLAFKERVDSFIEKRNK
ncbi:unnamed protein product [Phaedon cochleariae]|uniref:Uncharacterized protein n=1 Tax=Phaedon cochleariae TaxID=80249 RepID=A0A9P0DLN3_PHACE|nr:unnamed protein product [Phaedon cochleariae]